MAAEAEAQAILQVQQALADSLKLLNEAAPNNQVVKLKALEAIQKMADGKATKIIIPSELQGLAGLADGGVLPAGVLVPDGTGGHHHIAGLDLQGDAAAGAGAEEGVSAPHLWSSSMAMTAEGPPMPVGAGGDFLAQQRAGPDVELPVVRDLFGVVKQGGDGGDPARVAGQDAVAAHVARGTQPMWYCLSRCCIPSPSFYKRSRKGPVRF